MRAFLILSVAALLATPVMAQPPGGGERGGGERGRGGFGGGGGGMRGGMNPDDSFNRLVQSYGGSGDVLDYSKVSPESRDRYNRFAQMSGSEPMPTSGTVSRVQYTEAYNKRMESFRPGGGGFGRGPGGGGERGGFGGGGERTERAMAQEALAKSEGVRMTIQGTQGQPGTVIHGMPADQPGMKVVVGGPPSGQPERQASEEEVQGLIRRYDRDGDNRLSMEEAQRTDRLKFNFTYYDANKDGYIDISEGRTYMNDRANNRVPPPDNAGGGGGWNGGGGGGGWNGGGGGGWGGEGRGRDNTPAPEEPKPVVFRYGNLPTGLPGWFTDIDFDKDGQVGLYEWREAKKPVTDFVSMDLNNDGLITAEEYFRFKKLLTSEEGKMSSGGSSANGNGNNKGNGRDNRGNGGMGNWPGRGNGGDNMKKEDRRENKGERGGEKGNPFRPKN